MKDGDALTVKLSSPEMLKVKFSPEVLKVNLGGSGSGGTRDYNKLYNKPSINGVELVGDLSLSDIGVQNNILAEDTKYWNSHRSFIPECGQIIIYIDKGTIVNQDGTETMVPGIKVGDGMAYLIDLPWVGEDTTAAIFESLEDHIRNTEIHITSNERAEWNQKINVRLDAQNQEIIEFYR